jgi:hypothetical protein
VDRPRRTARLAALAAVAVWSIVPPYLGPAIGLELDVASSVEVVDHAVPGVLVLVLVALMRVTDNDESAAALGACALCGLWVTTSHATLVLDGGEEGKPWDAVLFHATPGPVLLALSVWLVLRATEETAT